MNVPDVLPEHVTNIRNQYLGVVDPETNQFSPYPLLVQTENAYYGISGNVGRCKPLDRNLGAVAELVRFNTGQEVSKIAFVLGATVALEAFRRSSRPDFERFIRHVRPGAFVHDPEAQGMVVVAQDITTNIVEDRFKRLYPEDSNAYKIYKESQSSPLSLGFAWMMTSVARDIELTNIR